MSGELGEADLARMARSGMGALSTEEGLELFDAADASRGAGAARATRPRVAARSGQGMAMLPPLFGELVRCPRAAGAARGAGESLRGAWPPRRRPSVRGVVLEIVPHRGGDRSGA